MSAITSHISGKSTGYRGDPFARSPGYNAPVGPTNMVAAGPGAGRTIYKTGTQDQQGAPNRGNPSPSRDILGSFGPESK